MYENYKQIIVPVAITYFSLLMLKIPNKTRIKKQLKFQYLSYLAAKLLKISEKIK